MMRSPRTLTAAVLLLAACGGKPKPETPAPDNTHAAAPATVPSRPASTGTGRSADEETARLAAVIAEAIYFEYDEATLSPAARIAMNAKAAALRSSSDVRLTINGHADERGSDEYNLALGMRRANAARAYLMQAGIASSRLNAVSYGEERPAVQGHDERAYAANRRDEFAVTGATVTQR